MYASLASGPSINCRPHNSRQRVDLTLLSRLDGTPPHSILAGLLGDKASVKRSARATSPSKDAEDSQAKREDDERQALLRTS
ncbi:hypothetical protein [Archangium sp.]|uniref:hypothetical protein n=1 Tax=Archangium sp. TaxID=1872627 RepID=UPI002D4A3D6F|nr:hypothetical protein [Archangium sp.]HYO55304.1 hypothetical protein [Archangium sp.]